MQYSKITIQVNQPELQEIVIALLAEYEFDSFDFDTDYIYAYIPTHLFREEDLHEVFDRINQPQTTYSVNLIEQKNWNEEWEKNFEPVIINSKLAIRAPFHNSLNTEIELVIEPKMSFGTGHHATTHMMCEMMLNFDFLNKKVLDFGSGTGILAILASKLNAASIVGIDNEEWAVENSNENAQRNQCSNCKFILGEEEKITQDYDIVLANINRHIILGNINVITTAVKNDGVLLISGILNNDEEEMIQELNKYNFKHINTTQLNNWSAMYFHKQ